MSYQGLPLDCSKSNNHSDEIYCEDENNIDLHEDEMKQETYDYLYYNDDEIKVTRQLELFIDLFKSLCKFYL